ncbi:MAG: T9SS type A sorting domain-containing protein [Flavobacteriaceae bacterium]|nr:T9SS type A sorting domain-containing protein [Flavobacteriaceae bacterium]
MKKTTIFIVITLLLSQLSFTQDIYKRVRLSNISETNIDRLHELGIDLSCGAIFEDNELTIELFQYEIDLLSNEGIVYEVLIEDMQKFYSERAIDDLPKARLEIEQLKAQSANRSYSINEILNNVGQYDECGELNWAVPANWNLNPNSSPNSFGGCLTYTQVLQELDDMRTMYPNLISAKTDASPTNQTTIEGRTVYYVRISDNPDSDEADEPETLYTSLVHSREAATVMNQLFFMWYILENYATDDAIKNLVNNHALYFIPVFNPDGFVWNQTAAPDGGGGQRKNRNTSAPGSCSTYLEGVDLNRNSQYYWNNGGSSGNSCNQTYRGTNYFSEPETQIMRDFFLLHDFKLALNHHSYKNAMLHAYAGTTITNPRPDEYSKYNHDMTFYNRYAHGPSTSISSLNSGNMNDWMLGGPSGPGSNGTGSGKNTMAWTPENGLSSEGTGGTYGGFWPQPSNYLPIARRAMRMNFLAAYFSGKYAKVHDLDQSDINSLTGNLNFAIENLGQNGNDPSPATNEFTLTVTAVSTNITINTPSVTENFTAAEILNQRNVNISYTLDAGIQPNDKIEYKIVLTNDNATDNILYEANISKLYSPTVIFADDPDTDNLTNWTQTGTWFTTSDAYSGTTAITTTNTPPYSNNDSKQLQMNGSVNLTGVPVALIQFYSKWDLERSFDYVQIEGSTNGSTWIPLCGKLTKPGAPDANNTYSGKSGIDNDFQPDGQDLYDGDTQGRWNMEEIVIDPSNNSFLYNQSTVYIRFDFRTDSSNRQDSYYNADFEGFTFDDFKITDLTENTLDVADFDLGELQVFPNPFESFLEIKIPHNLDAQNTELAIYDIRGRLVHTEFSVINDQIIINDLGQLSSEMYFLQIKDRSSGQRLVKRLIKK